MSLPPLFCCSWVLFFFLFCQRQGLAPFFSLLLFHGSVSFKGLSLDPLRLAPVFLFFFHYRLFLIHVCAVPKLPWRWRHASPTEDTLLDLKTIKPTTSSLRVLVDVPQKSVEPQRVAWHRVPTVSTMPVKTCNRVNVDSTGSLPGASSFDDGKDTSKSKSL